MDILICGLPDDAETDLIVEALSNRPLPAGYIYTLVSFLAPNLVRVQAMPAVLANAILDTGERISETAESLDGATQLLIERIQAPAMAQQGCDCECCHVPDYGACDRFEAGANGRCVYCDHAEACHPGTGSFFNSPLGVGRRGEK